MDPVIAFHSGLTVVSFLVFLGIVWWAYGSSRKARFESTALSVLQDEDDPASAEPKGRSA
ncbi:MAG: cbb3-type cytochrome oxidase subunit 3 [Betaproteobacteria bacterium]